MIRIIQLETLVSKKIKPETKELERKTREITIVDIRQQLQGGYEREEIHVGQRHLLMLTSTIR